MSFEIAASVVVALIATMATAAIVALKSSESSEKVANKSSESSEKVAMLLSAVIGAFATVTSAFLFNAGRTFPDTQLNYTDSYVSVYAGDREHKVKDGPLAEASFASPENMLYDNQTLYIVDSGYIRVLNNETVSTLQLEPQYYKAKIVRSWKSNIFVLTDGWYNEHGDCLYSLLHIKDDTIENMYDANTKISDFGISSDGTLWFIAEAFSAFYLNRIPYNAEKEQYDSPPEWFADLAYDVESNLHMTFDALDNLYISDPDDGIILRIAQGERAFTIFAGKEGENDYKDGVKPTFYHPTSIVADSKYLYVLDDGIVRRISLQDTNVPLTDTLAGTLSKREASKIILGEGAKTTFSVNVDASIASNYLGTLFLSDPENGVIYQINLK